MAQRGGDGVGIGRLWQIVERTRFHGGDGGGDVAKTGQHHNLTLGAFGTKLRDKRKPASVFELHVEDGVGGRRFAHAVNALGHRPGIRDFETARLHRPP